MSIMVVCETENGKFRRVSLELLSKARSLGKGPTAAVVFGTGEEAGALKGLADEVSVRTLPADAGADSLCGALESLVTEKSPELVLFGDGTTARDVMPRLAARLSAELFTNAVDLAEEGGAFLVTRPVFGGKAYAAYKLAAAPALIAFRPNSFPIDAPVTASTSLEVKEAARAAERVKVLERKERSTGRVSLVEAQAVVAAGRGLKSAENLKLAEDLADALRGAVGVSRAIVDAGWADHGIQVGKSGKTVAPALYIAAGISGAVHHTMGMDTSKVVVAINSDPKAPIFNYADYGIAGDALEILPALTAEIKKAAG